MPSGKPVDRPPLIVLAGLPAAGKSFFALRLGRLLDEEFNLPLLVIASDTVRSEIPALENRFIPELEPLVRTLTLERIESALRNGLCALMDDLNYYRSMRYEAVSLARRLEVPHALIHITTPKETCLRLNAERGRKIPDAVILTDAERFDPPGADPWDEPLAALNPLELEEAELKGLAERLLARARAYRPTPPPVQPVHIQSRGEELDLLSRRVVGELFRASGREADGKEVSRLRQYLVLRAEEGGLTDEKAEALFRKELVSLFSRK